jgi:hypothetical protein
MNSTANSTRLFALLEADPNGHGRRSMCDVKCGVQLMGAGEPCDYLLI